MTASDITELKKWKNGNGQKGAAQTIIEHTKDIEAIKEDLNCKADAVNVENIAKDLAEVKVNVKNILDQMATKASNSDIRWNVERAITILAILATIAIAIFKP